MQNSKWINEFNEQKKIRKIIFLYGNIFDFYFFNNKKINLDEYITENNAVIRSFFTKNEIKSGLKCNPDQASTLPEQIGLEVNDRIKIIADIMNEFSKDEYKYQEKCIYVKSASLLFNDDNSDSRETPRTIHTFKEFFKDIPDDGLLVIISEKLKQIPCSVYQDNPDVSVIKIDYPEYEIREEFINCIPSIKQFMNHEAISVFAKLTSNRTLREIEKIFSYSTQEENIDFNQPKDMISLYDFGQIESPWTKLKTEDVKQLDIKLRKRVLGQDQAIEFVKKVMIRAKLGLSTVHQNKYSTRPIGIFFFVGPSGVGKTELAKSLTEAVFGDENQFKRFDMSEYKEDVAINKLIGSNPGYVGYEEGGQLTNWLREHPFSVLLFDEIEKASPKIWDTFLQVLEDGRLTDSKGKTVYFNESIIIFTSNIGNKIAINAENKDIKSIYLKAVEDYFINDLGRIEILNRIGNNIIVFNKIDNDEIYQQIIISKLKQTVENIKKITDCQIDFDDETIQFLRKQIKDEDFGGRAVINTIETFFINEFSVFYIDQNSKKKCKSKVDKNGIYFE